MAGIVTIDDQLAAMRPLPPGTVMILAGYKTGSAHAGVLRARDQTLEPQQLRLLAKNLAAMARQAELLATIEAS